MMKNLIDMSQKKLEIDKFSIIDLMGLSEMPDKNKKNLLLDMNDLIWNDFLANRLEVLLTSEQMGEVKGMIDKGDNIKIVLRHITEKVPNFTSLLLEYSRDVKIRLLREHYISMRNNLEKSLKVSKSEKIKPQLLKKYETYSRALDLLGNYEWQLIKKLLYVQK